MKLTIATALLLVCSAVCFAQVPHSDHVYIVAEENRSYERLVGSRQMPYLNSLLAKNGVATQFYSNEHGSLANYFWVTSGQQVTTDDDHPLTYDVDNIVRRLLATGKTYRSYAEGLPYAGYADLYYGNYMKRHAPLPWYTDMGNSPTEMLKHVPLTDFTADVANGTLPNFAFITPDATDDMHTCPNSLNNCLRRADNWLKTNIGPLLARPEFQPSGDGLLIIWADEADLYTDNRCSATILSGCGGRILVALIGPKVKAGYQSTTTYHHQSVLRTMLMALGISSPYPAAADTAPDMSEFFAP